MEGDKLMKLFELTDQYQKVLSMIDDECDLEAIQDTLEGIEGMIADKAESIAKLIKSIEADEKAIKAEEDRLKARREALANRRLSIKEYLQNQLIAANIDKLKGTMFTVSIQNNPPSVQIAEGAKVPDKYYVPQPPKLDKMALLDDLKAGAEYEGISLQQTKGVRIR
jgi:type I site-specific restriction-modification system R (restriction) subunit